MHNSIVFELPGSKKQKFYNEKQSTSEFWLYVAKALYNGQVQIISGCGDSDATEKIKKHVSVKRKFTTFLQVQFNLGLDDKRVKDAAIKKVSQLFKQPYYDMDINTADNFQLVIIEV